MNCSTIIFDIGNVIIRFKPKDDLILQYSQKEITFIWEKIICSREWENLDRGTITNNQAINTLTHKYPKNEIMINSFLSTCYKDFNLIEETVEIIKKLKKYGYRLLLLSNYHKIGHLDYLLKMEIFSQFDGEVFSYQEGLLKPDPAIYNLIINRYKLRPEETLFIDDTRENIDAANKLGIKTLFLPKAEDLGRQLQELSILS